MISRAGESAYKTPALITRIIRQSFVFVLSLSFLFLRLRILRISHRYICCNMNSVVHTTFIRASILSFCVLVQKTDNRHNQPKPSLIGCPKLAVLKCRLKIFKEIFRSFEDSEKAAYLCSVFVIIPTVHALFSHVLVFL